MIDIHRRWLAELEVESDAILDRIRKPFVCVSVTSSRVYVSTMYGNTIIDMYDPSKSIFDQDLRNFAHYNK